MSLLLLPISIANAGPIGAVPALILVGIATVLSLKGVWKIKVYREGLVLRLGPFGVIRRYVPREQALLQSFRSLLVSNLRIDRRDGPILGPLLTVRMLDRWPEDALRAARYPFVNKFFREEGS